VANKFGFRKKGRPAKYIDFSGVTKVLETATNEDLGTLTVVNGLGTETFSLSGADAAKFSVVNSTTLRAVGPFDFATATSHDVTISATGVASTYSFTLTINDAPDPQTASFTQDGLTSEWSNVASHGLFVDDSVWIEAGSGGATLENRFIDPTATTEVFLGGVMVDPMNPSLPLAQWQGFDNRSATAGVNNGPKTSYNAAYAAILPNTAGTLLVAPTTGNPKTVWLYRGTGTQANVDAGITGIGTGGGATGCAAMVQITVYASGDAPSANSIKPPGVYVVGGKETLTTADIDYNALRSDVTRPTGAITRNWDSIYTTLKRPYFRWGKYSEANRIAPTYHRQSYPASDANFATAAILEIMTAGSPWKNELINRIVRDGLEVYAESQRDYATCGLNSYIDSAGFGPGGKIFPFFASYFLGRATMRDLPTVRQAPSSSVNTPFYAEDGATYWGTATTEWPSGRPLLGDATNDGWDDPDPNLGMNANSRDPNGAVDPHMVPQFSGTCAGGTSNTITFAANHDTTKIQPPANPGSQWMHRNVFITAGTGAGQVRSMANITGAWNATTRVMTVYAAWDTIPISGDSQYEYYPQAVYQVIIAEPLTSLAVAIVIAGKHADWSSSSMIMLAKRHYDNNGLIGKDDPPLTGGGPFVPRRLGTTGSATPWQHSGNINSRRFGPTEAIDLQSKCITLYAATHAIPSWPTLTP
jgi:hypothetical protein